MLAVIGLPNGTWLSQRDHLLLLLLYNTGARVSEMIGVKVGDVVLDDSAACVHLHGKGRKQRSVPLWQSTVKAVPGLVTVEFTVRHGITFAAKSQRSHDDACQRYPAINLGRSGRHIGLPKLGESACISTRDPAHHGNAFVAVRRRHQRHRTLAWS